MAVVVLAPAVGLLQCGPLLGCWLQGSCYVWCMRHPHLRVVARWDSRKQTAHNMQLKCWLCFKLCTCLCNACVIDGALQLCSGLLCASHQAVPSCKAMSHLLQPSPMTAVKGLNSVAGLSSCRGSTLLTGLDA